ncbi:hypothetical protein GCM10023083_05110 [Streptomyces phyllanthi]
MRFTHSAFSAVLQSSLGWQPSGPVGYGGVGEGAAVVSGLVGEAVGVPLASLADALSSPLEHPDVSRTPPISAAPRQEARGRERLRRVGPVLSLPSIAMHQW